MAQVVELFYAFVANCLSHNFKLYNSLITLRYHLICISHKKCRKYGAVSLLDVCFRKVLLVSCELTSNVLMSANVEDQRMLRIID